MKPVVKRAIQAFEDLPALEDLQVAVEKAYSEAANIEIKGIKFANWPDALQTGALILILFLQDDQLIFEGFSLSELCEKVLPVEKRVESLKSLLEIVRSVLVKLRKRSDRFDAIQKSFGFHSIYFIQMCKIKAQYSHLIDQNTFERLWLTFVYIERKHGLTELYQQLDLICSLVVLHLVFASSGRINLANSAKDFTELLGYEVEEKDYDHYQKLIVETMPEFLLPAFPLHRYHQLYLQSLDRNSLNHLIYLEGIRNTPPHNITLTPLIKKSDCYSSANRSKAEFACKLEPMKNITVRSEFNEIVNTLSSPEKQLLSPNLKRSFENTNHFHEFSKMYQWYKDQTKTVNLIQLSPDEDSLKASEYFIRFLDNSEILENYKKVVAIIDKLKFKERESFIKVFFSILDKLLESEHQSSSLDGIRTLLKDKEFLLSVLCLVVELITYITEENSLDFVSAVATCETNFLDVWKVLFIFAKVMGKNLPVYLRSRTLELELNILLKHIWSAPDPEAAPLAATVFSFTNANYEMIIKRTLNVLADRLYLVTYYCKLSEDLMEKTWSLLKKTLFFGYEEAAPEPESRFKTNAHLDLILLSCIYHVGYLNKAYLHLKDLAYYYNRQVLFSIPNVQDELQEFYHKFKNVIPQIHDDLMSEISNNSSRENPNSTPVQARASQRRKKIMGSPLMDNLILNIEKRNIENYMGAAHPRPRLGSEERFQFHKRIKVNEMPSENMYDSKNTISLFNIGTTFTPVSQSPLLNRESSPFNRFSAGQSQRNENEEVNEEDLSGIQTPNFK